jgi:hypothetical protein
METRYTVRGTIVAGVNNRLLCNVRRPISASKMDVLAYRTEGDPMTTSNAIGRLFPPSLFTVLGVIFCFVWRSDPVLIGVAACLAAFCISWFVTATVHVARSLVIAPAQDSAGSPAATPAPG